MPFISRFKARRIRSMIKRVVAWILTPFRWIFGGKRGKFKGRSPKLPQKTYSNNIVSQEDLNLRLANDQQRIEALQKYQASSAELSTRFKHLMEALSGIKKDHLLANRLIGLELSIDGAERLAKELIEYEKSYLTILLFQKIQAFKPLVERLSDSDAKKAMNKELQDMMAVLEQDNKTVSKLSTSDQAVAYASDERERFIKGLLAHIETFPDRIKHEGVKVLTKLVTQIETIPPLPLYLRPCAKVSELNMARLNNACAEYQKECVWAHKRLQEADSEEGVDRAANALILLYRQAGNFYASEFWKKAVAQKQPAVDKPGFNSAKPF